MHPVNSPKAVQTAYPIPLSSKGVSKFSENTSFCQRICNIYKDAIQNFILFLAKHKFIVTSMVLGTLLLEPCESIKAAFMIPAGLKKHFNFYNMNPKTLTREQLNKQPILLIHGNYHNQSAWISLVKKLKAENLGPIYTVNLPSGPITDKDYKAIKEKVDEIKSQYKRYNIHNIKINVIGHSRGGFLAAQIASTVLGKGKKCSEVGSENFGKVIKIGSVLNQSAISSIQEEDLDFCDRVYEITGKYDALVTGQSLLPASHTKMVNSGHLGLLYSAKTHHHVIQMLGC